MQTDYLHYFTCSKVTTGTSLRECKELIFFPLGFFLIISPYESLYYQQEPYWFEFTFPHLSLSFSICANRILLAAVTTHYPSPCQMHDGANKREAHFFINLVHGRYDWFMGGFAPNGDSDTRFFHLVAPVSLTHHRSPSSFPFNPLPSPEPWSSISSSLHKVGEQSLFVLSCRAKEIITVFCGYRDAGGDEEDNDDDDNEDDDDDGDGRGRPRVASLLTRPKSGVHTLPHLPLPRTQAAAPLTAGGLGN